ncbi:MAG: DUF4115 domain-containing protein [Trueperaceae bacterium]|nr:DUF4115 domain-containing protein [Trueperaceae bacterium]
MSDNAQPNSLRHELLRNTASDAKQGQGRQDQARQARHGDVQPEDTTDMVPKRRAATLGEQLRDARLAQGLELSDVAGITHIRKEYLQALDEGRYNDLPENVYTRNFIRLYAQAVGLDDRELLDVYTRERFGAPAEPAASEAAPAPQKRPRPARRPFRFDLTGVLPTLFLIVVLVGLALWGFNNFFFPFSDTVSSGGPTASTTGANVTGPDVTGSDVTGSDVANPNVTEADVAVADAATPDVSGAVATDAAAVPESPASEAGGSAATANPAATNAADASSPELVLFSLISSPPGATVSLDNYEFPTTTPIENAPITAGEKTLQVTLEGYQPYEASVDLSFDRNLSVALTPLSEVATAATVTDVAAEDEAAASSVADDGADSDAVGSSPGQISIQVEQDSWLEVYRGSSRGGGQTLLYRTAEAGESFSYPLPVYVHVGNGAGVRVSANGRDEGYVGNSGQVVGRSYSQ